MTLEHKYSQKGPYYFIYIYIYYLKAELKKLSIDVWFVRIGQYLAKIQLKSKYWEHRL